MEPRPAATSPLPRFVAFALGAILAALCLTSEVLAQRDEAPPKEKDEKWREDPYTKNEDEAIKAAGYERIDRIKWDPRYGSDRIEQAIGDTKIRWIETEHFRIGCALKSWKIPGHERDVRKRIRDELKELKKKLPTVKPNAKSLDPWLRAHLYAQRLENLYTQFQELMGVTDADFVQDGARLGAKNMGRGPYMGLKQKFGVILFHKESNCSRYLTTFTDAAGTGPSRWYLAEPDMFVFATAADSLDGVYMDDTALYAHVTFHVLHNMIDGYRGFYYRGPFWWQEGIIHSFRRELSKEHNNFSHCEDKSERIFGITDWERRVYGAVDHEIFKPFADIWQQHDYKGTKFRDHLEIWSRVEFLRSFGDDKFGKFIDAMKGHQSAHGQPPRDEYLHQQQAKAIKELWGYESPEALDEAWIRWVKKEYRGKK